MKSLLFIGHTFPEPTTTAAGSRVMQLLNHFLKADYHITFASSAARSNYSEALEDHGIRTENIQLNDTSFDRFISRLNPEIVIFDRFLTEEQYGWRVAEHCPEAIRVLDTEDLHFLRKARQEALQQGKRVEEAYLFSETAKREIASMLRSDLSLIISEVELELLSNQFGISAEILFYIPFLVDFPSEEQKKQLTKFEDRIDFVSIGNFQHAPNVDAIIYLKEDLWPLIRKRLPTARLHIYGAYAPENMLLLHDESQGFLVHGWAKDAQEVLKMARVCLAPLRFGAGLKGKILDAMQCGIPVVTTGIGAEGMFGNLSVPGAVEDSVEGFVDGAVALYQQKGRWIVAQANGFLIVESRFQRKNFSEAFTNQLHRMQTNLNAHRNRNFIGQILQHQSLQATKYMSKWIEEKNSN